MRVWLDYDNPEDSIIRIIRTEAITESDVFDGIDNDGDGEIDEYDETLPLIQDTTATVTVTNLNSGGGIRISVRYAGRGVVLSGIS